ncbi:MAG: hypothetical protein WC756_05005 [Taibaiella sp.]|jgi:hypothetical protein
MEVFVKNGDISISIVNGKVKTDQLLDKSDVKRVVDFLESQISILRVYHDGLSMGIRKIYSDIDSDGVYKFHRTGFGSDHADIL